MYNENKDKQKRLRRSTSDKVIAGVCGGLAERYNWDPTIVRIAFVLSLIFAGGITFWIYIAMWIFVPRDYIHRDSYRAGFDDGHESRSEKPHRSHRKRANLNSVRKSFDNLDERLRNLERTVTSDDWRLRQQFENLERS